MEIATEVDVGLLFAMTGNSTKSQFVFLFIVLIGLTQQTDKLEFAAERTAPEQRVI